MDDMRDNSIMRMPEVMHATGLCRSGLCQKMADDHFAQQKGCWLVTDGHTDLRLLVPTLTGTLPDCHAPNSFGILYCHLNTRRSYIGDHDGPVIQGSYRLAKSDRADPRDIQTYRVLSTVRAVWSDEPVAPCSGLDSQQYRGGVRPVDSGRVPPISRACPGLKLRGGNAIGDCGSAGIRLGVKPRNRRKAVRGCEPSAAWSDAIAACQSLRLIVPLSLFRAACWASTLTVTCETLFIQVVAHLPLTLCPFVPTSLMTLDSGGFANALLLS